MTKRMIMPSDSCTCGLDQALKQLAAMQAESVESDGGEVWYRDGNYIKSSKHNTMFLSDNDFILTELNKSATLQRERDSWKRLYDNQQSNLNTALEQNMYYSKRHGEQNIELAKQRKTIQSLRSENERLQSELKQAVSAEAKQLTASGQNDKTI